MAEFIITKDGFKLLCPRIKGETDRTKDCEICVFYSGFQSMEGTPKSGLWVKCRYREEMEGIK